MALKKSVLIVVHGMGEQRRNESLLGVMRPMLQLMRDRGDPAWRPDVNGNLAFDTQADAEVQYNGRGWRFAEYWWAGDVRAATSLAVAGWIFLRLRTHLNSMRRSLARAFEDVVQSVTERHEPKDPWTARLYHVVAIPLFVGMVTLLWLLTPLLVLALLALGFVRLLPGVPAAIGYMQSLLQRIAIDYLGDIYIYLRDPVQAAQVRGGLERMIEEATADAEVDRIVLFAHSTGNLVVYDALANLNLISPKKLDKVQAFVGIGSILPMAWNKAIVEPHDARFFRPIPNHIHWYHLWTRFDIGPAGPLELPQRLQGQGPEPCNRRVTNADDLLLDHTGYWGNFEQVHTLLLEEMGGHNWSNDFWRGPGKDPSRQWCSRSEQTWVDYNMRRKAVAQLAFVRLITWPTLPVSFPLFLWFNGWAKGVGDFVQLDWLANKVNFQWLAESFLSADLSILSTVGRSALLSVLLFAASYLVVYLGFKVVWWNRSLKKLRERRAREFMEWRAGSSAAAQASARATEPKPAPGLAPAGP